MCSANFRRAAASSPSKRAPIALAMTGGRPEYLPVLIAAVEAFLDPASSSELLQATSGAPFPVVMVNGPIAKQIRLNSGFGCLGPDPQYPAGASIGRALRQMQQNLGGALPGTGTMAPWGNNRYNNTCLPRTRRVCPRAGCRTPPNATASRAAVTQCRCFLLPARTTSFAAARRRRPRKKTSCRGCTAWRVFLRVPHYHYLHGYEEGTPGFVVISKVVAADLATMGYSSPGSATRCFRLEALPKTLDSGVRRNDEANKLNGTVPDLPLKDGRLAP